MDGLIIDNFAGGGGASTGIEAAGYPVDYAINHCAQALAMHTANHPGTVHLCEDVFKVSPRTLCAGRRVALAWFSPDCKHFSKAKGGKPVSKRVRGLAWVAVRLAKEVQPDIIILENVEEFVTWGPLLPNGKPDPAKRGLTFRRFVGNLLGLGYVVEWRELVAADFGTPTTRKRLFLIARCDGESIVWPERTHRSRKERADLFNAALPTWRAAAECIDWSIPCPSIFARKKPLAENTLRRIAAGLRRFLIEHPEPFIVPTTHQGGEGRVCDPRDPLVTVTGANRGELALAAPVLVHTAHGEGGGATARRGRGDHDVVDPLPTACASNDFALVSAHVTKFRNGAVGSDAAEPVPTVTANGFEKRAGGAAPLGLVGATLVGVGGRAGDSRPRGLDEPTATGTTKADVGLVAATLVTTGYTEREGQAPRAPGLDKPLGTVVAGGGKHAVVAAYLAQHNGGMVGHHAEEPVSTLTQKGCQQQVVSATLIHFYSSNTNGGEGDPRQPAKAVTAEGQHHGLVAALLTECANASTPRSFDPANPLPTQCANPKGGHFAGVTIDLGGEPDRSEQVRAFLVKYYGNEKKARSVRDPLDTVTTKDRLGLVTIRGVEYRITDIGLRTLAPRELANAQGFPVDYILTGTKTSQVARIGNSVCPPVAEAIVRANMPRREQREAVA